MASEGQQEILILFGLARRQPTDVGGSPWLFELTDAGRKFDDAANVYGDKDEAGRLYREAYLALPVVQALMQGLHGRKAVPVTGALHMLARHELADPDNASAFRTLLTNLNGIDVVVFSNKHQTVRLVEPLPDADEQPEEKPTAIRIVEPDRPYSNRRHLREVLREGRDFIWWADMHFEKRGLEPLADEADASKVKEIRVLMVNRPKPSDVADYKAFVDEMAKLGIAAELRVVPAPDRDWHDRFIITRGKAWNVPPLNTIFKGDYSQFTRADMPPFEAWWDKGTPLA